MCENTFQKKSTNTIQFFDSKKISKKFDRLNKNQI